MKLCLVALEVFEGALTRVMEGRVSATKLGFRIEETVGVEMYLTD